MIIEVYRLSDNGESTIGAMLIDGEFECYTIEDESRTEKVFGETRIPEGEYEIGLRTVGGHHQRYSKYEFHKGMLHILDVPNFKYVLIHIGNNDDDTAGCILVGNTANNNKLGDGFVGHSTDAYIKMYKKVINAIDKKEKVIIKIKDLEN